MKRFEFRPYKVAINKWRYNGVPMDSDKTCTAILCASEEDADLLLRLLEEKIRLWKDLFGGTRKILV